MDRVPQVPYPPNPYPPNHFPGLDNGSGAITPRDLVTMHTNVTFTPYMSEIDSAFRWSILKYLLINISIYMYMFIYMTTSMTRIYWHVYMYMYMWQSIWMWPSHHIRGKLMLLSGMFIYIHIYIYIYLYLYDYEHIDMYICICICICDNPYKCDFHTI
jgi:hypothetical protein